MNDWRLALGLLLGVLALLIVIRTLMSAGKTDPRIQRRLDRD